MNRRPQPTGSGTAHRAGAGLLRAVVAATAVIGVLAMHGLTMNHDAAMTSLGTVFPVAAHAADSMDQMAADVAAQPLALDSQVPRVDSSHAADRMRGACLALLTGLIMVAGAGRALVWLRRQNTRRTGRLAVAWLATALDRLRPDLGELSVLRT